MNNLLIFFALPLATILIAIVLERIWKNYILVSLFTFAVYLIVAYALGDSSLLILVIAYTLLAFIAAFLSMLFRKVCKRLRNLEDVASVENTNCNCNKINCCNNSTNSNSQNFEINATVSPNTTNSGRTGNFRGQYRRRF